MATEQIISPDAIIPQPFVSACGESPFWSPTDEAFFWVDIPAGHIHSWSPANNAHAQWQLPEQIGCIAKQQNGNILAACETGIYSASLQSTDVALTKQCSIEHPEPQMRFNDGRCDRQGRLWVTSFMTSADKRPVGKLFRYTPDGLSAPLLDGFMTPNGMAFSPDNRTLYIADSHASVRKVWALDFDLAEGVILNRRLFVDMSNYAGRPDGAAIDTDGCYWVAGMDDGCIFRFTPDGKLDRIVRVPMKHPTMCAFGGKDMKSLFVTSLKRGNVSPEQDPHAGQVVCFDSGAQGIPEVLFSDEI